MENEIKTRKGYGNGDGVEDGSQQSLRNETKDEKQFRVVITEESNQELENLLIKIKDDNETIEISKSDIANYMFKNLNELLSDADLKVLKNLYFDERKVLQSLLKQSQGKNELPLEIKKMVRDYYGLNEREKKRSSRNSPEAVPET